MTHRASAPFCERSEGLLSHVQAQTVCAGQADGGVRSRRADVKLRAEGAKEAQTVRWGWESASDAYRINKLHKQHHQPGHHEDSQPPGTIWPRLTGQRVQPA